MISAEEAKKESKENLKEQINCLTKSLLTRADNCIKIAVKEGKTHASFAAYNETGMSEAVNIVNHKIKSFGYKVKIINRWHNTDSTNMDFIINQMEYVFEIDWGEDEQDNS